jgi:HK97 family phage major capsid protein
LSYSIVSTAEATRAADQIQYIPGGDASAVTADGLRSLYWGLRAGYRANAVWLMSSATASGVDKLKASGSGEYL